MAERNIGLEILEGYQEVKAFKAGKLFFKDPYVKIAGAHPGDPGSYEIITIGFRRLAGCKCTHYTGLGAGTAKTQWSGRDTASHRRSKT
jgi:hypothetical protein